MNLRRAWAALAGFLLAVAVGQLAAAQTASHDHR